MHLEIILKKESLATGEKCKWILKQNVVEENKLINKYIFRSFLRGQVQEHLIGSKPVIIKHLMGKVQSPVHIRGGWLRFRAVKEIFPYESPNITWGLGKVSWQFFVIFKT